jgi:5'-nucleotidase
VSGINPGPNVGINVIYSGTVSAALEGAILGIPSIAISVEDEKPELFLAAAGFTRRLVTALASGQNLPPGLLLNVNVPDRGEEGIQGVRVTVQARSSYRDSFQARTDPRGKVYYWLAGERKEPDPDPMTDERAIKEGFISVTPVQADLTARGFLGELAEWPLGDLWRDRNRG